MTDFIDDETYYQLGGAENEEDEPVSDDENEEDENDAEEENEQDFEDDEDDDIEIEEDEQEQEDDEEEEEEGERDFEDEQSVDEREAQSSSDEEDESDDEDDDDSSIEEDYEKVDSEFKQKFIQSIHPEHVHETYDQIKDKTIVKRDENDLIIDEYHRTIPLLTKYERARILGLRITQLNKGAKPYINVTKNKIIDNHIIAEQELNEKRLPFIIMRPIPNGGKEYWRLEDLEIIVN